MMVWPKLHLTEYERQFVDIYADPDTGKPGVLRRAYRLTLTNIAQPESGLADASVTQNLQISRRARVFAMMFTGNLDAWRLSVRNANGTHYINPAPRSQQFPVVSSLVSGSSLNAAANGGVFSSPIFFGSRHTQTLGVGGDIGYEREAMFQSQVQSAPWCIEPNWVCQPNETLIFQGTPIPIKIGAVGALSDPGIELATVLDITVFAWEFPTHAPASNASTNKSTAGKCRK